ncbi:hypothetical protein NKJ23_24350 [Mesorhizobium sp. M0184]|uniref:hypothetical protein n=1 Tax=Mesorhizobium sp. M0184 TaxID=2956906 RepID=UPI003338CD08
MKKIKLIRSSKWRGLTSCSGESGGSEDIDRRSVGTAFSRVGPPHLPLLNTAKKSMKPLD